ncbi:laminin subunit alpha [Caerostris extrusa]|uniref:Laminin subunit alpha n=1 Tax=Caerostris extrusa TaxID=172846 RepID=A0AAV4TQS6_CAEEX|nr:laminin subunit alpha [Caerostris extrusa]
MDKGHQHQVEISAHENLTWPFDVRCSSRSNCHKKISKISTSEVAVSAMGLLSCDLTDPRDPYKLLCRCQHNTCGPQCEQCCPGFQQKKWRHAIIDSPFVCELQKLVIASDIPMNVNITKRWTERTSLDIHGHYEGGGVCKNCRHNTMGINCNQCKPTFYRPYGKLLNATDVCQPCNCDLAFSTGNCADGNGLCECRVEFLPPRCDQCNVGYYGYPYCKPCDCNSNGTLGNVCEVGGGQCPCKPNYGGT